MHKLLNINRCHLNKNSTSYTYNAAECVSEELCTVRVPSIAAVTIFFQVRAATFLLRKRMFFESTVDFLREDSHYSFIKKVGLIGKFFRN